MCRALVPHFDWGLADFDIRNVFHFSGGYELPFGKNKKFLATPGSSANAVVGGWSVNWIVTAPGWPAHHSQLPNRNNRRNKLQRL